MARGAPVHQHVRLFKSARDEKLGLSFARSTGSDAVLSRIAAAMIEQGACKQRKSDQGDAAAEDEDGTEGPVMSLLASPLLSGGVQLGIAMQREGDAESTKPAADSVLGSPLALPLAVEAGCRPAGVAPLRSRARAAPGTAEAR